MSWNEKVQRQQKLQSVDLASLVKLDSYSDVPGSLVKDVVALYLDTAPAQIKEIQSAAQNKSFTTIHQVAHSLKSASGQIGAQKVSEVCRDIEEMTHHSHPPPDSLSQSVEKLTSLFNELTLELKSILKTIEDK